MRPTPNHRCLGTTPPRLSGPSNRNRSDGPSHLAGESPSAIITHVISAYLRMLWAEANTWQVTAKKRTRKQAEAIAALLDSPTIKVAAERIGLHEKTLQNWLKQPAFIREFDEAKTSDYLACTWSTASRRRPRHIDIDGTGHNRHEANVRLKAATQILTHLLQAQELIEVESRLRVLEEQNGQSTSPSPSFRRTA